MKKYGFFENIIFICIVLVIIQTLLDDLSVVLQWEVNYKRILLVSGFVFDVIFTLEFIIRSSVAIGKKKFGRYFWYERGWVDLLSSLPLLILNSGPSVYALWIGGASKSLGLGLFNILKVVKAIRVTRILRLVRIIKIFGKIQNTESIMAQHHTAAITTNAVFSMIIVMFIFSMPMLSPTEKRIVQRQHEYEGTIDRVDGLTAATSMSKQESARYLFRDDPLILKAAVDGQALVESNEDYLSHFYLNDDYLHIEKGGYSLLVSLTDINAEAAMSRIVFFFIILSVVVSISFLYASHFAQRISDIIHIMNNGFRKKDYNLMIKIPPEFEDHEVFRLANFYNNSYLPAKMRRIDATSKKQSSLSMDHLAEFGTGKKKK